MGRFRYTDDDDDDGEDSDHLEGEQSTQQWEFIADPGNEGAIVNRSGEQNEFSTPPAARDSETQRLAANHRTESSISKARSDFLGDYNYIQDEPEKRRWWLWIVGVAILIHLAVQYAPPAPPPTFADAAAQHAGWQSFLESHTRQLVQSLTALAYHTPVHIGKWWMLGLVSDLQQWYQDFNRKNLAATCRMQIPAEQDEWILDTHLFGQSTAIETVQDAVTAWDPDAAPLLLYFAGMPGVGKLTTARLLAQQLFSTNDCPQRGVEATVLTLDGATFAETFQSADETSVRMQLTQRIVSHVQNLNGSVVVLQNVHRIEPAVLSWLVQELSSSATQPASRGATDRVQQPSTASLRLRERCRKTVFVFTSSSVGARAVMTNIRVYGGIDHNIPLNTLRLDMMHEMDTHFGVPTAKHFHAVAPFFPLGRQELGQILRLKVAQLSQSKADITWNELVITDAAVDALIDPSQMEYISWKARSSGEQQGATPPILTFSSAGASPLQDGRPLMNKLQSKVKTCFAKQQPDKVAVIDFFEFDKEVVLQWCSRSSDSSDEAATKSSLLQQEPCDVACRFKL